MNKNQCDAKRFYDTEFEAIREAAIASHDFQAEMIHYQCGSHWHIANKNRELRSKVRPFNRTWCEVCEVYMKPSRYRTHLTRAGHLTKKKAAR